MIALVNPHKILSQIMIIVVMDLLQAILFVQSFPVNDIPCGYSASLKVSSFLRKALDQIDQDVMPAPLPSSQHAGVTCYFY
jgi:hypothetical protein